MLISGGHRPWPTAKKNRHLVLSEASGCPLLAKCSIFVVDLTHTLNLLPFIVFISYYSKFSHDS